MCWGALIIMCMVFVVVMRKRMRITVTMVMSTFGGRAGKTG